MLVERASSAEFDRDVSRPRPTAKRRAASPKLDTTTSDYIDKSMTSSMPEENRRKRLRKGTKSCCECKRRKIKCTPSPDPSICSGCLERSTPCLSQEHERDDLSHNGEDSAMARRMARVESLLEALIERAPWAQVSGMTPASIPVTESESLHVLAPISNAPKPQTEIEPRAGKLDLLHKKLTNMLPCQADVDFLLSSSHGWWLIQQHMMVHLPNSIENDFQGLFNVNFVVKGHPITIAKLLLCVAICIQQLAPEIDMSQLQMKSPPREVMSSIVDFLIRNVTSDDDITGSIEGVECLALQGVYEVNAGNLRKSWLSFRKALAISALLGLHRVTIRTSKESPELKETKRHYLLYQVSRGERYLSTLLGVPSGTGSGVLPFDNTADWLSPEDRYHKHLYDIAGLILARNQENYTHSFSTTQIIGEKLEALAEQMPSTWWEIPTNIPQSRTQEASTQFERVMCQIWHFELTTLLHLPFMLRAASNRRYEYSRISCLDACRNLIKRWVSIRETNSTFYFSNLLDFEAFTAATTLLLGLLVSHRNKFQNTAQERDEDSELMEMVVRNFERLKRHGSRVSVGDQSILVIRTLQGFLRGESSSGNLRLEIPFFGIIQVALNGTVEPLAGERILGANAGHHNFYTRSEQRTIFSSMAKENCTPNLASWSREKGVEQGVAAEGGSANHVVGGPDTILQLSGGHFQLPESSDIQESLDASEWSFSPDDMIFFDSLVNTDLVGNWTL